MAGKLQTAVKNIAATPEQKSMMDYVRDNESTIKASLPGFMGYERFMRVIMNAMNKTPELMTCTPRSFVAAILTAAQLGLEPNTPLGHSYLIPYNDGRNKSKLCQLQIGYRGYIDMAYKSGKIAAVEVQTVYDKDEFEIRFGIDPALRHIPAIRGDRGEAIGYWAMLSTTSGGHAFTYMSKEDAETHAKRYSKSFSNGPWQTDFDEMAKKTVLRRLLKTAPMTPELRPIMEADFAIKEELAADMLTIPNIETEFIEVEEAES